jgi:hypothetical protein
MHSLGIVTSVTLRDESWPASDLDYPFESEQLLSSALHLQTPQWGYVYHLASQPAALALHYVVGDV